jgi:hypothetical protein
VLVVGNILAAWVCAELQKQCVLLRIPLNEREKKNFFIFDYFDFISFFFFINDKFFFFHLVLSSFFILRMEKKERVYLKQALSVYKYKAYYNIDFDLISRRECSVVLLLYIYIYNMKRGWWNLTRASFDNREMNN